MLRNLVEGLDIRDAAYQEKKLTLFEHLCCKLMCEINRWWWRDRKGNMPRRKLHLELRKMLTELNLCLQ